MQIKEIKNNNIKRHMSINSLTKDILRMKQKIYLIYLKKMIMSFS